ncbi:MAG: TPM domain-containing protein [Paludibacteraceae bacterium]|nr:TPM domain-containing protein [Paludibacteraceae bacterium]
MKKRFLSFIAFALFAGLLFSQEQQWISTPQTVPNPKDATHNGWISDPNDILNRDAEAFIDSICWVLKKGVDVEMAVVVIWSFDEERYDAFDFCQELFNYWGIGSAGNKGVLVFLSVATSDIRIHTGAGLEGLLPDAVCYQIISDNKRHLSEGKEFLNKAYEYKQQGNDSITNDMFYQACMGFELGVSMICYDISETLMTDEARQELILGWKPKPIDTSFSWWDWYFILAFIVFTWLGVKMSKAEPKQEELLLETRAKAVNNYSDKVQSTLWLAVLFPLPIVFLYFFLRKHTGEMRLHPANCNSCGKKMTLLPQTSDRDQYLTDIQKKEKELGSRSFDVWQCEDCKQTHVLSYKGKKNSSYLECTKCGGATSGFVSNTIMEKATTYRSGYGIKTYCCAFCGATQTVKYIIPKIEESSSSGSGGRRSSGGSSGGSWGGGRSYGGGAGSKF